MKTHKENRKVQASKANYMTDEAFADLKDAMEDALAYARGERRNLKITRIRAQQLMDVISAQDVSNPRIRKS